jgi:hypothetical protein
MKHCLHVNNYKHGDGAKFSVYIYMCDIFNVDGLCNRANRALKSITK